MDTDARGKMKKEIKEKYSRLFDKLAKEEMQTGSIYNINEILSMLQQRKFANTGSPKIPEFKKNLELHGTNQIIELEN